MANDSDRKLRISHRVVVGTVAALVVAFSITAGLVSREQVAAQTNPTQVQGRQVRPREEAAERASRMMNGFDGGVAAVGISGMTEAKNVNQALRLAPESTIQFKNLEGAPVSITDALARFLKTEDLYKAEGLTPEPTGRYVMRPNLRLVNNSDRRLTAISLAYENADGSVAFCYFERLSSLIEPHAAFTLNNRAATAAGDPASVVAKVTGAMFEDGTSWGDVPPPPPPPPPPPVPVGADDPAITARPGVEVIRKSGGMLQDSVVRRVEPNYPPLAKAAQVSGAVVVEVLVDTEGRVTSARAVTGHPLLKDAAVAAARDWKFSPTSLSGKAVQVVGTLTFNFAL